MQLAFHEVGYEYAPGRAALRQVSFTAQPGEFIALIGHTGSGKSTIAQLCNALLTPTSGRVLVDGVDTATAKGRALAEIRRKVGLVFQYPEQQLFAATVEEDVAFGPQNLGLPRAVGDERVLEALETGGLPPEEFAVKSPFTLSGGQQRRAALAGTLAMRPEALVLDEPAAGMDPHAHAQLNQLLARLNAQGTTIILITHNMQDAAQLATKVIALDHGQIATQGTPEQVFLAGNEEGFLPPVAAFSLNLQARGIPVRAALTNEQLVANLKEINQPRR